MTYPTRPFYQSLILAGAMLACTAAAALGQTSDPKSRATGAVSGRVTVGDKPAPGILITAGSVNQPASAGRATSDADGNYRINGLPTGQIMVMPAAPLYILPNINPMLGPGKTLNLAPGEAVDGIDFKLTRGAVITGRVTDADGRPLIEERITLLPVDENGAPARQNFPRFQNYQMYQTDDRGIYRIYGVPAGHYKVSVGDDPGTNASLRSSGYYQRTYYPDATDAAKAAIVDLSEGAETKNIDISLGRRAQTYAVSGRIVDADTGKPLPGVSFAFGVIQKNQNQKYIAGTSSPGTPTNSLGEFRLDGVGPGHYAVFVMERYDFSANATTGPSVFSDPLTFEVVDDDVTNLEIKAQQGLSLSGVVTIDGISDQKPLATLSSLKLGASVTPPSGSMRIMPEARSSAIAADGSFSMTGLRPGKVSFYLMGPNGSDTKGFSIARTERGGVAQDRGVDIQPGEIVSNVRIVLAHGTGVIRGQVKFEGATLPSDLMMFVGLSRDGLGTRSAAQPDARGQFVIENLAAGTYEVNLQVVSFGGRMPGPPQQQRQTVTVTDGAETPVLFTLNLSPKDKQ